MVLGGQTLYGPMIQDLRRRIADGDLTHGEGRISTADVIPAYIERVVSDVRLARPMKVVMDCGNGVAGCGGAGALPQARLRARRALLRCGRQFPRTTTPIRQSPRICRT